MSLGLNIALDLLLRSLAPQPAEAEALQRTDPADLTLISATENIREARFAGLIYGIDPAVLLGIAWHESRYKPGTITKEPGRRVSCGCMTPIPQRRCSSDELTLEGGYLAGAAHLRHYLDIHKGSMERALVAYAGGSLSVFHPKRGWRAWKAKREFLKRASLIRRPNV